MKKILSAVTMGALLSTGVLAHEVEAHEEKSNFYVAAKALMILGNDVSEEGEKLKGESGAGFGIDLGYRLAYGFSFEIDGTYATNDVKITNELGESEKFSATYITNSFDIAYRYPFTESFAGVIKGGYEHEYEDISGKGTSNSDGFAYAAALTYELNEHFGVLAEYEGTTIDSPRGNSVFAGVEYTF